MKDFRITIEALDRVEKFAYGLKLIEATLPYVDSKIKKEVHDIFEMFHSFSQSALKAIITNHTEHLAKDILAQIQQLSDSEYVVSLLRAHIKTHNSASEMYGAVVLHGLYIYLTDILLTIHDEEDPLHLELCDIAFLVGLLQSGLEREFLLHRLDHGFSALIDLTEAEEQIVIEHIVPI